MEKIIGQRPGRAAQAPPCGGRSWRIRFPTSPSICSAPTFHAAESSSCRAEASARRELPAPWSLHAVSHTRGAGLLQAASQRAAFCGFCGDTAVNSGQASPAGALGEPRPWRPGPSSGPSSRTSRRARMGPMCRGKGASFIHALPLIGSFIHSFIHSLVRLFNKCLLDTYCVPGRCGARGAAGTEGHEVPAVSWGAQAARRGREWGGRPMARKPSVESGAFRKWHSAFGVFLK